MFSTSLFDTCCFTDSHTTLFNTSCQRNKSEHFFKASNGLTSFCPFRPHLFQHLLFGQISRLFHQLGDEIPAIVLLLLLHFRFRGFHFRWAGQTRGRHEVSQTLTRYGGGGGHSFGVSQMIQLRISGLVGRRVGGLVWLWFRGWVWLGGEGC